MIWVNATIRLASDPRLHTTRKGSSMASGFGFADIEADNGLGLALVAFGSLADELLRYRKGDSVRVSGPLKENSYTNSSGIEVRQLQVAVDGIAGIRRAQPVQRERKPKTHDKRESAAPAATEPFNDELSF